jgi:predicted nucleic-acid-binding protein
MIGLDTNVVLRYMLQDDPKQTPQVNRIVDNQLSAENPGFISLVAILEIVWVLRSLLKRTPAEIAAHLEQLLAADTLEVQNETISRRLLTEPNWQNRMANSWPQQVMRLALHSAACLTTAASNSTRGINFGI